MASTSWQAAPWMSKQEYLLKDGTVVLSPDVEVTTQGRRVRVAGMAESVAKGQYQELIERAVDEIAAARGTRRWLRLNNTVADKEAHSSASPAPMNVSIDTRTTLHLTSANRTDQYTTAVFEFEAVSIPQLKAYVWVHLASNHYGLNLQVNLTHRNLHPSQSEPVYNVYNGDPDTWVAHPSLYRYDNDYTLLHNKIKDVSPFGEFTPFGTKQLGQQPRQAAVAFLEVCKGLLEQDGLVVPDLRDPDDIVDVDGYAPMLEYKFVRTSYTAELKRQLLDFVQAGPALNRVKEHYDALVQALRDLGVVINPASADALTRAVNGEITELPITLGTHEEVDVNEGNSKGIDRYHNVVVDLASGSVVVDCTHPAKEQIAEAWNVALFKADVSGQTDTLLAYAQAHGNTKERARLRKILKQRKVPDFIENAE